MFLTAKEEKFCQGIVKGLSQADAYRQAYDCEASSNETIHTEASLLRKDPQITQRIDQFKELNEIKELALTPSGDKGELDLTTAGKMVVKKGELMGLYKGQLDISGSVVVEWANGNKGNNEKKDQPIS